MASFGRPMNVLSIQSRVAYGCVGNAGAAFALQRLGHEAWTIDTVAYSNHLGHPTWRGRARPAAEMRELVEGLAALGVLGRCNAVLIYGTKAGLELACQGIPTIVAGEAWMRNKGFTYDASSPEEYHAHLDRLPFAGPLEPDKVLRARKYAFHFFFRRMVPLEVTESTGGWPPFKIQVDRLSDLAPGRHAGLDLICDGLRLISPDDQTAVERGALVYDALYAQLVAEGV